MEDTDSEYEEEEAIILVELNGIIDTNFLLEKPEPTKILGIDTERPILQLGHYIFAGEYEDTLGTLVAFQPVEKTHQSGKEDTEYKFCCKTDKKLSMKRIFLQEKGIKDLKTCELSSQELNDLVSSESSAISDENSITSIDKMRAEVLENGFEEAISNIQLSDLPDADITKAMEFCVESVIHQQDNTHMEDLTEVTFTDKTLHSTNDLVVNQKACKNVAIPTLSDNKKKDKNKGKTSKKSISSNAMKYGSFSAKSDAPTTRQGMKRKRLTRNDNFSGKKEMKIVHEVVDGIVETVTGDENGECSNQYAHEHETKHLNQNTLEEDSSAVLQVISVIKEQIISQENFQKSSEINTEPNIVPTGSSMLESSLPVTYVEISGINVESTKNCNSLLKPNELENETKHLSQNTTEETSSVVLEYTSVNKEEEINAEENLKNPSENNAEVNIVSAGSSTLESLLLVTHEEISGINVQNTKNENLLLKSNEAEKETNYVNQNTLEEASSVVLQDTSIIKEEEINAEPNIVPTGSSTLQSSLPVMHEEIFCMNVQNTNSDNSLLQPNESENDLVSSAPSNSDNMSRESVNEPPVRTKSVSVGTTYCPIYEAVESSTDKAKSPVAQHEWELADDDKCSSSEDTKLCGNDSENLLSSEISQSSDPRVGAVSVASSSTRESVSECETSNFIDVENVVTNIPCEVSQSSKNSLMSQIAEPSENEGHSSSWNGHNEQNFDNNQQQSVLSSKSTEDPCRSSDDVEVRDQSASLSYEVGTETNEGSSQCEVSQSKNGGRTCADSRGNSSRDYNECDVCGQSDDPAYEASSPHLEEGVKDPCASSDDVMIADNSESSRVEPKVKNSLCEVSQSSKSRNRRNQLCDGNTSYQYDLKDTSECEVYGQFSDNAYESSFSYTNEGLKDPCASSDDVNEDFCEVSDTDRMRKAGCEVTQSSKFEDNISVVPNVEESYEEDIEDNSYEPSVSHRNEGRQDPCASSDDINEHFCEVTDTNRVERLLRSGCEVTQSSKFVDSISVVPDIQESLDDSGDSNECRENNSMNTVCEVTQSSKSDVGQSSTYESFEEDRESSNECDDSPENFGCEVTQSSKFEDETFIILDVDESSADDEEDSIEFEGEISQSFKSGDGRRVTVEQVSVIDEGQCSSQCDDDTSKSYICEVTQSFRSGDEVFIVPSTRGNFEAGQDVNQHENQSKSSICEVSQSSKSEIVSVVHDAEENIIDDDREDSNECEVYDHSFHSSHEQNDSSMNSGKDPCESSDDVQLLATTPSKGSGEGECSSSSKITPAVSIEEEHSSSVDSFPNSDRYAMDLSLNEASDRGEEENMHVQGRSSHCESSKPSTSFNVSSSSSSIGSTPNLSSHVYSSPDVISDSSEINVGASTSKVEDASTLQFMSRNVEKHSNDDEDPLIDSSSSSSSIEVISYENADFLPSKSTQKVQTANSSLASHQLNNSPVGSSVTQSLPNEESSPLYLQQVSDDSNDIIEVVESSTSSKPNQPFEHQAESSSYNNDVQSIDEEVEVFISVESSPNKDKCSSSYDDSVCTSAKSTNNTLISNEASSSRQDSYVSADDSNIEIEVCDSKENIAENVEICEIAENSSNEASSSHNEIQETVSDNRPSLLDVIVSSASDFRNSLIHESSGFVRNKMRNLLVSEVTDSSSSKIHGETSEFPESLTNEAAGFSREVMEPSGSQSQKFFVVIDDSEDHDQYHEAEVTESSDSKIDVGLDLSTHSHKGHSSLHQVSQSSEIVNTDSSSSRIHLPISNNRMHETLQRDFVQSSTNISLVSTMSPSNDSYAFTEQVTSAEESMPAEEFYEPLPHEVPGSSSSEIEVVPSVSEPLSLESDMLGHSDAIQSSSENHTLFEANLSMYQKIETVDTEVSSSPCHDHVQIHSVEDNDHLSEVEVIEINTSENRDLLNNDRDAESNEIVASTVNTEILFSPPLYSAVVEVGESSACEVTASHLDKAIPSFSVFDSPKSTEGNNCPCEVSESSSHRNKSSSQRSETEAEGSSSCNIIGSTTGVKKFEYDSSSSSYSIVEVEDDDDSKSANEAEVLSPDLVIEANDSESLTNEEVAATDLYICESSKSSENNSKNSSVCEVTESCTTEQNESSESFTNDSKVSSCSASGSTIAQQVNESYNENEFTALSSHEAIAKSYEMFSAEESSHQNNQRSQIEVVSQSTSEAVELSMYEHVADFESDSVQSSSFEATQFSVNEQIKAISSPPQFSDSNSNDDQSQINTNPFISPDGEYMPSENCDLSVLGALPSTSRVSQSSPFQVCTFPSLLSTSEGTPLYRVDQVSTLAVESNHAFDLRTSASSSFSSIVPQTPPSDNFGHPESMVRPLRFNELPQAAYSFSVEVPESLPIHIEDPPYEDVVVSSEDVAVSAEDVPVAAVDDEEEALQSDYFKLPSSTSN